VTAEQALEHLRLAFRGEATRFRLTLEVDGSENGTSQWLIAVTVPARDPFGRLAQFGPTLVELMSSSPKLEDAVRDTIRTGYFHRTGQRLPEP
jgi:hypothetical protein